MFIKKANLNNLKVCETSMLIKRLKQLVYISSVIAVKLSRFKIYETLKILIKSWGSQNLFILETETGKSLT